MLCGDKTGQNENKMKMQREWNEMRWNIVWGVSLIRSPIDSFLYVFVFFIFGTSALLYVYAVLPFSLSVLRPSTLRSSCPLFSVLLVLSPPSTNEPLHPI